MASFHRSLALVALFAAVALAAAPSEFQVRLLPRMIDRLIVLGIDCWLTRCALHVHRLQVEFKTSVNGGSSFVLAVKRNLAPNGVDRFFDLIKAGYYNDNRFFRVVPGFVVQVYYLNANVISVPAVLSCCTSLFTIPMAVGSEWEPGSHFAVGQEHPG